MKKLKITEVIEMIFSERGLIKKHTFPWVLDFPSPSTVEIYFRLFFY